MNRLIEFFVKQKMFSDLIIVFVIVVGVACLFLMKREAFPNIKFDIVIVSTIFPGASPDEVERLITNPLERELKEVEGIKKINSVSRASTSNIILQLDPDQTTDMEAKADIQDVIDRFKDLPSQSERPVVSSLDGGSYPIIQVSLTGPLTPIDLRKYAREIERDLESLPDVAKVTPTGMQDLEIHVETDLRKLSEYRISFEEVIGALKSQNVSIPAGSIVNSMGEEILIRTVGDYDTVETVERTVVRANDLAHPIRIKDLAQVGFKLKTNDRFFRTNGEDAINLTVLKKSHADSIHLVEAIKEKVSELELKYKGKLNFRLLDDESVWIKMRLNTLSGNLLIGLVLVLLILSLLLPPSIAIFVAVGIPFSFLGTMIVFYQMGYSLNLLSMLGLIIVVGMLVDDAVVITENSMRLLEEGYSPEEAATKGAQQVVGAVFGSVMTTVLAFMPLMFMSGIFGKFVKFIPVGVIVALLISLLQAYFILPNHFARWAYRPQHKRHKNIFEKIYEKMDRYWNTAVAPGYAQIVTGCIRFRYRVLAGVAILFLISLFTASKLKFVLFPSEGIEIFFITAEAPIGTELKKTSELIRPVESKLRELPSNEVENFTAQIGLQMKDPGDPNTKYGSHFGMLVVYLTPTGSRQRSASDIVEDLRIKMKDIKGIKLGFEKVTPGPPVGKAVSVGVSGLEYSEILKLAELIKTDLSMVKGVTDLELNHQPGNKEILVNVIPSEAAAAGLTVSGVGMSIRAAYEGIVSTSIKKLDEEIDIRVSLPDKDANDPSMMSRLLVSNARGSLIPLGRVARFKEGQGIAAYVHEKNQREVKVLGEVDSEVTDATKVAEIVKSKISDYKKMFPGLGVSIGGENADTEESMKSLFRTFGLAIIGIFIILVLTFQRLSQPLLVGLTIPIGVMSVIYAFFIHNKPLSFMGLLGIVALAGVIVNNAIVLVDFVNILRAEGKEKIESIILASKIRLRPIFLTTVTTVAGILPTAYGIGGTDDFVKPIALALGWGLLLGSILVLVSFPSMIAVLDDVHELGSRFRSWRHRGR
ncbi:MAG: efflux RND transporter permease subunit [Bdellovibrionales bacterium]|nr:efflux RND transporter permease subunit [Bdellovibrionales bacterium]